LETVRLKKMRQPSHVERVLERLVTQASLVPADAYQLRNSEGLPRALQRVLLETAPNDGVWTCWSDGFRIWLFTGEMSLPLSRERGAPVLTVSKYSEQGYLQEVGQWTVDREGSWRRCAD
jgi:hypothetical protein